MKVIYKYNVLPEVFTLMPPNAKILSVGQQGGDIVCWALVDKGVFPSERRKILGLPTGVREAPDWLVARSFIGTVQMDNGLVFHFFDCGVEPHES